MNNWRGNSPDEIIDVYIRPNSPENAVDGCYGKRIKIRIACPPEKGRANKALIDYIALKTGLSKTSIKILSGHKSSFKTIAIKNPQGKSIQGILTGSK
ncbi:MAG: DUF167 domain-containing protein [Actinobacteria bacterium]|nr:DUF167 domain-containing protein [Actinomycetota bacterium]